MIMSMLIALALQTPEPETIGGTPEWVPRSVNLAIFLIFLYFVLRKPLASFFAARAASITAGIDKAKLEKQAAEAKLREVESRLEQLGAEQARIRAEAEAEAASEAKRVAARAEEEAAKIAETAGREIDGALKNAKAELQRFAAEKSVELAESLIRSEITDADGRKMVDDYAAQLEGVKR